MALGGSTFTLKNKVLPGAYLNFVSASKASPYFSERGSVCIPIELDWGVSGKFFEVTNEDFFSNAQKLFGYNSTELKQLSDLFMNVKTAFFYRLNGKTKASCAFGEAKYEGIRGNDLKLVIKDNFTVITYLDNKEVDKQEVTSASELVDNDYVVFNKEATLTATAGLSFTGGENNDDYDYDDFFVKAESESFNILASDTTDDDVKELFINFTKRMRDEVGVKFQTVLYKADADYQGVISVENEVTDSKESDLIYWVAGIEAGCEINKSTLNKIYDGNFSINADYTQSELTNLLKEGKFVLHRVKGEKRVLSDRNSLVNGSEDFKVNQVIRVLDQIANDIALLFRENYLGQVPNDTAGRISLWNDIVTHHKELSTARAIEAFSSEDITVSEGETKSSVLVTDCVTPVCAMAQLYMTVIVS